MSKSKIVSVRIDGEISHHIAAFDGGDLSICGPMDYGEIVETPKGTKVNCLHCKNIFKVVRNFTDNDFVWDDGAK